MQLNVGDRVNSICGCGSHTYNGTVVRVNGIIAHIQRDDFDKGVLWIVHQKSDGSWGSDGESGTLGFLPKGSILLTVGSRVHGEWGIGNNYDATVVSLGTNTACVNIDGHPSSSQWGITKKGTEWGANGPDGILTMLPDEPIARSLLVGDKVRGIINGSVYAGVVSAINGTEATILKEGLSIFPIFVWKRTDGTWGAQRSEGTLKLIPLISSTSTLTNSGEPMSTLREKFTQSQLTEPEKTFRANGITDSNGTLTSEGSFLFLEFMLREFGNEFKAAIDPLIDKPETSSSKSA
jgi:hypothetical protein